MEAYFSALVPYDSFAQTIGVIAIVVIAFDVALEVGRAALQMAAYGSDSDLISLTVGDPTVMLAGVAPASLTADMFL
jgi:hypothetical protein